MSLKRKRATSREKDAAGSSICSVCTLMTGSPRGLASLMSSDGYKHHSKVDLEISSATGCHCCKMLFERALAEWPGPRSWSPRVVALDEKGVLLRPEKFTSGEQKLSSLRYKRAGGIDTAVFDIYVAAVEGNAGSRFLVNEPISMDVESTRVMRSIEKWLAECQAHENCLTRNSPRLPSRVIYVGHESQDVRLYEAKEGETGEYVALSYCWGGPQAVTTTLSTLELHTTSLDVPSLPQTVCDAILTTRRLGFSYLWVDALCIIQDCPEDRSREILNMGEAYKNSLLTIVAANNPTVTAGFLHPRPSPQTCGLPFLTPDGKTGAISIVHKFYALQPKEPLYTRAWALQEFLLSPRLLTFGTYEVTYQCPTTPITPAIPSHRSYDPNWPCTRIDSVFERRSTYIPRNAEPDEMALRRRRYIWQSLVQDYTSRTLSVPEDKLPALAGIAKELESAWHDGYLAGMWRSDLLSWLLWRSNENVPRSNEVWRAPSWSWASVDGKISFHWTGGNTKISEASAKILDVDSEPRLYNGSLGQKLVLEAVIMKLKNVRGMREGDKEKASRYIRTEDDAEMEDDGTLKFVLLGFNYLSAFGLIVREIFTENAAQNIQKEERTFERVGMLCSWLPKEVKWWPKMKRRIVMM